MGALDYIKTALELAKKAQSVELQGELLNIKEEYLKLQEENLQLKERNTELERRKAEPVVFKPPSYFVTKPDGTEDGPFCQRCHDADGKLVRTHEFDNMAGVFRRCDQCKTTVTVRQNRDINPYGRNPDGWT